jgi:hypothetical protein
MATRGILVKKLAEIYDIPVTAVDVADRALSEAGLRTKSTRGRAATQMSAEDIVSDAIALSGNWGVKAAPPMVARLVEMTLTNGYREPIAGNDDDKHRQDEDENDSIPTPLSKSLILSGSSLLAVPSGILQMKENFGASFAEVLRVLNSEHADKFGGISVAMIPELVGASIEFRYSHKWFTFRFGSGMEEIFNEKMAQCEGYTKIVLRHRRLVRLAEILKA